MSAILIGIAGFMIPTAMYVGIEKDNKTMAGILLLFGLIAIVWAIWNYAKEERNENDKFWAQIEELKRTREDINNSLDSLTAEIRLDREQREKGGKHDTSNNK
jgi:hypothetical protein